MPKTIQRLETEQAELARSIGDPELFRRSPADAAAALQRLQAVEKELEDAFSRWEELESAALAKPRAT
jgi:ATP-binding cassette subfamily F protein uup